MASSTEIMPVLPVQEGRNNRFCETRACLGGVLLRAHAIHYTCFMDLVASVCVSLSSSRARENTTTFFQLTYNFLISSPPKVPNFSFPFFFFFFNLVSFNLTFLFLRSTRYFAQTTTRFSCVKPGIALQFWKHRRRKFIAAEQAK